MRRRQIEEMVKLFNLELISLVRNNHWKAKVRNFKGDVSIVTFPCTGSEYRGAKNKAAQLRNISSGVE